jgi:hypothetical protein
MASVYSPIVPSAKNLPLDALVKVLMLSVHISWR